MVRSLKPGGRIASHEVVELPVDLRPVDNDLVLLAALRASAPVNGAPWAGARSHGILRFHQVRVARVGPDLFVAGLFGQGRTSLASWISPLSGFGSCRGFRTPTSGVRGCAGDMSGGYGRKVTLSATLVYCNVKMWP